VVNVAIGDRQPSHSWAAGHWPGLDGHPTILTLPEQHTAYGRQDEALLSG